VATVTGPDDPPARGASFLRAPYSGLRSKLNANPL
jgi:hypothetical protein